MSKGVIKEAKTGIKTIQLTIQDGLSISFDILPMTKLVETLDFFHRDFGKPMDRYTMVLMNGKRNVTTQFLDYDILPSKINKLNVKFEQKPQQSAASTSTDLRDEVKKAFDEWDKCGSTELLVQAIDQRILQSSVKLDALVNHNDLPIQPYEYQLPDFTETLYETKIEEKRSPNLLIHELNTAQKAVKYERSIKIQTLHEQVLKSSVAVMIGPSGSGKTRTIFEYLTAHFGLFITASMAFNGGSADMEKMLFRVKNIQPLLRSIELFYGFQSIVAIRIIFLQRLKEKYGKRLTPYHWLIVQEMPKEIFGEDVFDELSTAFKVNNTGIDHMEGGMPVFLDEAQAMNSAEPDSMCCSGSDLVALREQLRDLEKETTIQFNNVARIETRRKPASPILHSFTALVQKKLRFAIAGTGVQFDEFNNSLASSIAKRGLQEPCYIKLGSFMEFKPFVRYISHYLPNLDKDDQKKIHECVRGRCCFTACFITFYLRSRDVQRALDNTISHVVASIDLTNKERIDLFNKLDKSTDAWLIETGLGLISTQRDGLDTFLAYPLVLKCIKIVEPLVFEAIRQLMSPVALRIDI